MCVCVSPGVVNDLGVGGSHHVSSEDGLALHVLETELADVQPSEPGVLLGVGRVVPGVQLVASEQDGLDHVAALRDLTLDAELLLLGSSAEHSCGHADTAM